MEFINRIELAEIIYKKIYTNRIHLSDQFKSRKEAIGYVFLDDLLPEYIAIELYKVFPGKESMILKKSIKEDKFVAFQMNLYNPILEEILYAFQDAKIVELIGEIFQVEDPIPDKSLYAGGISMMGLKQFLNPHLDNSHDKERERWRVLNLLYYISPDWKEEYGGNLELWPDGLAKNQVTICSKFNRLVIMVTHNKSLHSVSPIVHNAYRCCISNYYFSKKPVLETDKFHVTSFRGRPEHKFIDTFLKVDAFLRMSVRKIFKNGIWENPHVYKNDKDI